jgi:O-methyltransferase
MKNLLWIARKLKALYIKFRLHILFEPFSNILLLLSYMSKISKFINKTDKPKYNDFFSVKYNYDKRYDLYKYIIESEKLDEICYLEFGVSQGHSLRWWLQHNKNTNSKFYGFDTFTGLPEKWGYFDQGTMSIVGDTLKINDGRCELIKGLFQDTLHKFLKNFNNPSRKIIHLDADIYSSTLFVLTNIAPFLKKDDLLLFDEFTVPLHEFKAFYDFTNSYYINVEMIAAVNNYFRVAFKIK